MLVLLALALRPRGRSDLIAPPSSMGRVAASPIMPTATPQPATGSVSLPQDVQLKVWVELRDGHVINAIKLVRDATGMGLKEAKDYVDTLRQSDPELR